MSQDLTNNPISFVAGADLSAASNLYKAVKFDPTSGGVVIAGLNDHAIGILVELATAGNMVAVACDRTTKCTVSGSVTAGDRVVCDASGFLKKTTATTGVDSIGFVIEDGSANDIVELFIEKMR